MTAYYRNRETGTIQGHPVSGLGEFFNSDEVGEDAKPILPLGTAAKTGRKPAKKRAPKPPTPTVEELSGVEASKVPEAIADGNSNKEGAN